MKKFRSEFSSRFTLIELLVVIAIIAIVIFTYSHFLEPNKYDRVLKIVIPEDLDYSDAFKDILQKYNLVSLSCRASIKVYKDVLIYRKGYRMTDLDRRFVEEVSRSEISLRK